MEFIKEWTFTVCITLIVCVMVSLLLPSGTVGKYGKIIVSLFIFVSLITPLTKNDISLALPKTDEQEIAAQENDAYANLVSAELENQLSSAGYTGVTVFCMADINEENEIEISELNVSVPDEYSCDEIRDYIYDNLGMSAEVYSVGE